MTSLPLAIGRAALLAFVLLTAASIRAQADDECVGATPVALGSATFTTAGYTASVDPWSVATPAGADRWFSWAPTTSGPYSIRACNLVQAVDTVVEIYEGTCGLAAFVAYDDDSCGHFGVGAVASATLNAGRSYLIRVGTYGPAGEFELAIQPGPGALALQTPSGCGGATLTFGGLPAPGRWFTTALDNPVGTPLIGFGASALAVPLCGCLVGHEWSVLSAATPTALAIPPLPSLVGATFLVQGAELTSTAGCTIVPLVLTDTWLVTVGL